MEERKAENELSMKREIKSLLEAYLQLKAKLDEHQMESEGAYSTNAPQPEF